MSARPQLHVAAARLVAGVDEAGRGPLAGPVVAAAVILDDAAPIDGLADSKTLTAARRDELFEQILTCARSHAVGWADRAEIDRLNILEATMLAMRRAVLGLHLTPALVEVDGNRLPDLDFGLYRIRGRAIVGGDGIVDAISAASIVAKVSRDRIMLEFDRHYPGYDFARHKGYATVEHRRRLHTLGPCPQHRRTFHFAVPDPPTESAAVLPDGADRSSVS